MATRTMSPRLKLIQADGSAVATRCRDDRRWRSACTDDATRQRSLWNAGPSSSGEPYAPHSAAYGNQVRSCQIVESTKGGSTCSLPTTGGAESGVVTLLLAS